MSLHTSRLFLLFFFKCYGDHRDLHSFPTRRSSDLRRTRQARARSSIGRSSFHSSLESTVIVRTGAATSFSRVASRLGDRKSTRLNSSHSSISYAVFCLKKKNRKLTRSSTDIYLLTS